MAIYDDGGPAFPMESHGMNEGSECHGGMTLRDFFAAAAIVGAVGHITLKNEPGLVPNIDVETDVLAKAAYALADSMISRRQQQ